MLNIDFGQRAAENQRSKLEVKKISANSASPGRIGSNQAKSAQLKVGYLKRVLQLPLGGVTVVEFK